MSKTVNSSNRIPPPPTGPSCQLVPLNDFAAHQVLTPGRNLVNDVDAEGFVKITEPTLRIVTGYQPNGSPVIQLLNFNAACKLGEAIVKDTRDTYSGTNPQKSELQRDAAYLLPNVGNLFAGLKKQEAINNFVSAVRKIMPTNNV